MLKGLRATADANYDIFWCFTQISLCSDWSFVGVGNLHCATTAATITRMAQMVGYVSLTIARGYRGNVYHTMGQLFSGDACMVV